MRKTNRTIAILRSLQLIASLVIITAALIGCQKENIAPPTPEVDLYENFYGVYDVDSVMRSVSSDNPHEYEHYDLLEQGGWQVFEFRKDYAVFDEIYVDEGFEWGPSNGLSVSFKSPCFLPEQLMYTEEGVTKMYGRELIQNRQVIYYITPRIE